MCARRFLLIVFFLTLLVVAGGFAIYQWGGDLLVRQATPRGHFSPPPPNSGPDYRRPDAWIAHPDLVDDPSRWLPPAVERESGPGNAAVFFVHPTTYLAADRWNAPLRGGEDSDGRAALFVRSQASAFNGVGTVWAPRYRQAAYGAFLLNSADARHALDLAYRDVLAAFDEFLRGNPSGPLVLAGHSQGSLHLSRLLADRRPALADRLVAAYVVGWPLSDSADLPVMSRRACTHAEEVGCILSWQSFAEPANPALVLNAWEGTRGASGVRRVARDMVCVNPLTGTRDSAAPPQANLGTLLPSADFGNAALAPGRVGASCRRGFLSIDGDIPDLGPFVLPGNNYHVYDYALFWANVRADAGRRLGAWRR